MATITLAEIRLQCRQRADMEKSQFVKDSEITSYVNNSAAELYDILCEAYGSEYYVQSVNAFTEPNVESYDLPADFYEIKGVDIKLSGQDWFNCQRFNFNERNRYQQWTWDGITEIRYRIVGDKLMFNPIPDSATEYRVWYVPVSPRMVNDTDTLKDLNAYSEYIITDVVIKMLAKEESDVSVFMAQKQALLKRITDKAQNRDAAQAPTIADKDSEMQNYWFRGWGSS